MPNSDHLRQWLNNNLDSLRATPDRITDAANDTMRFRWHGIAMIQGVMYGIGINMHDASGAGALGGIWIYGNGVVDVALHPRREPRIPMMVRPHLLRILQGHALNRGYYAEQDDWLAGLMNIAL